ncbi:uncharacterized protein TrAtP1_001579 [Trichoderma atroviride]|uniref:uncharacterized protein n=1 Tax=Hypocrea atroviridis TaxID=63577 RepID=UPI0033320795|nr:hypothetical protein TrAtP1_001579 [Trichoderma atroviride]
MHTTVQYDRQTALLIDSGLEALLFVKHNAYTSALLGHIRQSYKPVVVLSAAETGVFSEAELMGKSRTETNSF